MQYSSLPIHDEIVKHCAIWRECLRPNARGTGQKITSAQIRQVALKRLEECRLAKIPIHLLKANAPVPGRELVIPTCVPSGIIEETMKEGKNTCFGNESHTSYCSCSSGRSQTSYENGSERWGIIYHALMSPRKAEEIARDTGVSVTTVRRVISTYNRLGPAALETPGKGGRRHEYMSVEQERRFLQPFFARAAQGEIATAEDIQRAFEAEVKHAVHITSIYRLLDRHGWRKLVPRPRHPKANPEAQAAFKKTLRRRFKQQWPHAILTIEDPC